MEILSHVFSDFFVFFLPAQDENNCALLSLVVHFEKREVTKVPN